MRYTLMLLAFCGLLIAGCESTPRNEEPVVDETTEEQPGEESTQPKETESPKSNGQDAKHVVYVLGVNGMD